MSSFIRRRVRTNRRRDEYYTMYAKTQRWFVYILECADETYYTGITTNLERRLNEHNTSNKKGAKYTRHRRPVKIVAIKEVQSRSEALKIEAAVKRKPRLKKINYLKSL